MSKILKISFLFVFSFWCFLTKAGDVIKNARLDGSALTSGPASLYVKYDKYSSLPISSTSITINSSDGLIEFGIDESKRVYHNQNFTSIISVTFSTQDFSLSSSGTIVKTLLVNYFPPTTSTTAVYKGVANYSLSNVSNITVSKYSIATYKDYGLAGQTSISNPSDLYLELTIKTNETMDFDYSTSLPATSKIGKNLIAVGTNTTYLQAYWDYIPGAESYELEWIHVDDYDASGTYSTPKTTSSIPYDFEHDATRIVTTDQYYSIPLVYERGWVLFRVRGVGRSITNNNVRLEGTWSNSGSVSGTVNSYTSTQLFNVTSAHEIDKFNWSSSRTYAEDGKSGIGISYEDGTMKNRQSVAKLNTEDKVITQSTLYDWQGRPAISVLPAPINENYLGYKANLNKKSSSVFFDKNIFDNTGTVTCTPITSFTMDPVNSTGAAKYYSPNNTDQDIQQAFVPDAEKRPYVQVEYYPNQTGKVKRQSLPGGTHYLGSGKEQTYFYSQPSQEELVRLFGTEVGQYTEYQKLVSIDPNGQTSASYIDDKGRTIATALSGTVANLLSIPDATNPAQSYTTVLTNNLNDPPNYVYALSNTFMGYAGQAQQIFYNVVAPVYTHSCAPSLCLGCIYELDLSITDDCGNEMLDGDPIAPGNQMVTKILGTYNTATPPQFTTTCPANTTDLTFALSPNPTSFTPSATGNYQITKTLKLSQLPINQYVNEFVSSSTCYSTQTLYQAAALATVDVMSCSSDCATCSTAVMSFSASLTAQELSDLLDQCQSKCITDPCISNEKLLLLDFKPGGYFAKFDASNPSMVPTPSTTGTYSLSIFNSSNVLNGLVPGLTGTWTPWYAAPKGSYGTYTTFDPAYTVPSASLVVPNALSTANYISTYNNNFAKPWLQWHPEYCKLQFYCDGLISAITSYSNLISNTFSFDDACAQGLLYPISAATSWQNAPTVAASCPNCTAVTNVYVPLATYSGTTALSGSISSALTTFTSPLFSSSFTSTYSSVNANVYQEAIAAGSQLNLNNIVSGSITPVFGGDNCHRDQQWEIYKRVLLINLNNALASLLNSFVSSWSNSSGGCASVSSLTVLPGYLPKFPDLSIMSNPVIASAASTATTSTTTILSTSSSSATSQCSITCNNYVNQWLADLAPCGITSTTSTWANLHADLEKVCRGGCDVNDPFGASNTYTSIVITVSSTTYTVSNFQDVLNAYGYTSSPSCNAYLMTMPKPKGYSFSGSSTTAQVLDGCGCDKILSTHSSYTAAPSCTLTEYMYFESTLGIKLPMLGSYVCACQAAATATAGVYTFSNVPSDLIGLSSPSGLACQNCIPCNSLTNTAVVSAYTLAFGSTTPDNLPSNVLENFYNGQLNMNNTATEWLSFINDCNANNLGGGSFGSSSGIAALTTSTAIDLGSLINTLYINGYLTAGSYSLNTTNGNGFFSSNMWKNPSAWSTSAFPPTITPTVDVATSITGSVISVALSTASSTLGTYGCSFNLNVPASLPTYPTLTSGLSSASFSDIKGSCWTHTVLVFSGGGVTTATVTTPDAFVITLNYVNSSSVSVTYTFTGNTGCFKTLQQPLLPATSPSCTPYLCSNSLGAITYSNSCLATLINNALNSASTSYSLYLADKINEFKSNYYTYCYANVTESTKRAYSLNEFNYTLYYYDRPGNLVHTVPPASVGIITNTTTIAGAITYINSGGTSGSPVYPDHSLNNTGIDRYVSHYQYNTFDAPNIQVTPDGGETKYLYDYVGRLVASQNAKQAADKSWSYTLYDVFGRINEVGVVLLSPTDVLTLSVTVNPTLWPAYVTTRSRQEVTQSFYDTPQITALNSQFSGGQLNLHNRISATTYEWTYDGNNATYDHATAFSYDDHGNVNHIVKQNPDLNYAGSYNEFKHIEYEYDLISGNVKTVIYQRGERDQFHHKYFYDADNRLHEVQTSSDGKVFLKDAKYFYYQHGPLARTELGEKQVQGMDYAYNIQGWVKGINSTILGDVTDQGKDAAVTPAYMAITSLNPNNVNRTFARDAASYNLNYFSNDYSSIKTFASTQKFLADISNVSSVSATGINLTTDGTDLYNGNISSMVTSIYDINTNTVSPSPDANMVKPQFTAYRYDQLHRLKQQKAYNSLQAVAIGTASSRYSEAINLVTNAWITPTNSTNYVGTYSMGIDYDGMGNIMSLTRNGEATYSSGWLGKTMDLLTYTYNTSAALSVPSLTQTINVTNQLKVVGDGTTSAYTNDIDAQTGTNYTYNEIGSLKGDVSEEIQTIDWTDAHKVKSITRTSSSVKPDIEYEYDEFARRISKTVKAKSSPGTLDPNNVIKTYYIMDADGNVLSTMEEHIIPGFLPTVDLTEKEKYIYGSSRLGAYKPGTDMYNPIYSPTLNYLDEYFGKKDYELTNHLGNVISTVSDRKRPIDGFYTYVGNGAGNYVFTGTAFGNVGPGLGNYNFVSNTSPTITDYYMPDISSVSDYYAFGMVMPNRNYAVNGESYRYGYNDKENDDETHGSLGSFQDYGMRNYDTRLGRFTSVDPLKELCPNKSPNVFAGNSPIAFIDKEGAFMISPQTAANYPKLNQMLLKIDQMVNDVNAQFNPIMRALASAAGINIDTQQGMNQLRTTLSYGSGPIVTVNTKLYSRLGETNPNTLDIELSGVLVNDVETNSYTKIANFDNLYWQAGKIKKDYLLNGGSMMALFITVLHESGHHMSLLYGGGTPAQNNSANGPDNMDRGFETRLFGRNVSGARMMVNSGIIRPDNSQRSRNFPLIGVLTPSNIRNFFFGAPLAVPSLPYIDAKKTNFPSQNLPEGELKGQSEIIIHSDVPNKPNAPAKSLTLPLKD
jgi:RHS repeat-associated protein